MYSADTRTHHAPANLRTKNGRYRVSQPIHWLIAVPPIQGETFRGELEPPSSALQAGRRRR